MFIKYVIKTGAISSKISNPKPNKELLKSLQEGEQIIQEIESGKRKGYHNINKLFEDLENQTK